MSLAIDTSAERMVGEQAHRHSVLDERTEPNMTLDGANIHLVGPGRVGRAFLDLLVGTSYRLVGLTSLEGVA